MTIQATKVEQYLADCEHGKMLNEKTLRAYRCDILQFKEWLDGAGMMFDEDAIMKYLKHLNETFSPSSAKRKLASLRSFSAYLFAKNRNEDPFNGIRIKLKHPKKLPRTIPLDDLSLIIGRRMQNPANGASYLQLRNTMLIELLIATGMRVSELCALNEGDFDWGNRNLLVMGKGSKERIIQLESENVLTALNEYIEALHVFRVRIDKESCERDALFLNRFGARLTEQSARSAIAKLARESGSNTHVTPHMFRHTFATMLLENDVDIRYIQALLGHSSVKTTEIYTHVSSTKLREIMRSKNPRDAIKAEAAQ